VLLFVLCQIHEQHLEKWEHPLSRIVYTMLATYYSKFVDQQTDYKPESYTEEYELIREITLFVLFLYCPTRFTKSERALGLEKMSAASKFRIDDIGIITRFGLEPYQQLLILVAARFHSAMQMLRMHELNRDGVFVTIFNDAWIYDHPVYWIPAETPAEASSSSSSSAATASSSSSAASSSSSATKPNLKAAGASSFHEKDATKTLINLLAEGQKAIITSANVLLEPSHDEKVSMRAHKREVTFVLTCCNESNWRLNSN
jgi:hypothetical protein